MERGWERREAAFFTTMTATCIQAVVLASPHGLVEAAVPVAPSLGRPLRRRVVGDRAQPALQEVGKAMVITEAVAGVQAARGSRVSKRERLPADEVLYGRRVGDGNGGRKPGREAGRGERQRV